MPKLKRKPQNSFIGENAKLKKETGLLEAKLAELENNIKEIKEEIKEKENEQKAVTYQLKSVSTSVENSQRKLSHKKGILQKLSQSVSNSRVVSSHSNHAFCISNLSAAKRKLKPTSSELPPKAKFTRRKETFAACSKIHGGTETNADPTIDGILDTVSSKVTSEKLSEKILHSKPALVKKITQKSYKLILQTN